MEAAPPTFFEADVNRTVVSPVFTAACGFEVSVTEVGTVKATVFASGDGVIVSEIDTQPGYEITFSSSASGKEFSFPFATAFHYEFPDGATAGSPAIVTATGLLDKVPGISAESGRVIYGDATVLFVDANGVPIVDFGAPTFFTGHVNDLFTLVEAGCAALAP
jgi:hypothetical protein